MKDVFMVGQAVTSLLSCIGFAVVRSKEESPTDIAQKQTPVEQQARSFVDTQRNEAGRQALKSVDADAIDAIRETENAIRNITDNKTDEAIAAIQRASSKLDILLSRNSASALITIDAHATVIETPLHDSASINDVAQDAGRAFDDKDFPTSRVLLNMLRSEICLRTLNLPLATYPTALKNATRLLQEKKSQDAKAVLLAARDTVVLIDRIIPLPLLVAREAINEAQALSEKDKDTAIKRLEVAREELDRARALGYAGKDPEYSKLLDAILTLEKQLKGNEESTWGFAKLKDKLGRFLKRQSERERPAQ